VPVPTAEGDGLDERVLTAIEDPAQAQIGFPIGARIAAPDTGVVPTASFVVSVGAAQPPGGGAPCRRGSEWMRPRKRSRFSKRARVVQIARQGPEGARSSPCRLPLRRDPVAGVGLRPGLAGSSKRPSVRLDPPPRGAGEFGGCSLVLGLGDLPIRSRTMLRSVSGHGHHSSSSAEDTNA
jgi:hypothetical protein